MVSEFWYFCAAGARLVKICSLVTTRLRASLYVFIPLPCNSYQVSRVWELCQKIGNTDKIKTAIFLIVGTDNTVEKSDVIIWEIMITVACFWLAFSWAWTERSFPWLAFSCAWTGRSFPWLAFSWAWTGRSFSRLTFSYDLVKKLSSIFWALNFRKSCKVLFYF